MQRSIRGHDDPVAASVLEVSASSGNARHGQLSLADQTLERCLLETQRQVIRLEEIAHRLTSVGGRGGALPAGVLSLVKESNRRLQREVDEFTHDAHALLQFVRPTAVPIARRDQR